jgi:hypothetical protein
MQEHGMWKQVLPLSLIVCASGGHGQSQPATPEVKIQRKAMAHTAMVEPIVLEPVWVDPRQQLARTMVSNAFHERQAALRRDTEKLLSLAAELKENVDKTSPNILSMDVIKKAQEIEKLAKSVKDKMKDAY